MKINRARVQPPALSLGSNPIGMEVEPPQGAVAKKSLTFGDFVAAVYGVCGERSAEGVVRFAVNGKFVVFQGRRRFVVS